MMTLQIAKGVAPCVRVTVLIRPPFFVLLAQELTTLDLKTQRELIHSLGKQRGEERTTMWYQLEVQTHRTDHLGAACVNDI